MWYTKAKSLEKIDLGRCEEVSLRKGEKVVNNDAEGTAVTV